MQVNSYSAEDPKLHKNKQDQTAKEQSIHILLVEDFAGDTLLVQQVLATCSVDVKLHVARDGQQALTMLADPNLKANLILLDLNLPRLTGFGVLERYHPKEIPVVVFSASSMETDKELAFALGASDYVEKPNDLQQFADVVCEIVEKWAGGRNMAL